MPRYLYDVNSSYDVREARTWRSEVVGTRNIGTLYGWALAEAGHTVTHLVRAGG